ncbi:hypothetical protein MRX96_007093 [Rhipicephalus microplus]
MRKRLRTPDAPGRRTPAFAFTCKAALGKLQRQEEKRDKKQRLEKEEPTVSRGIDGRLKCAGRGAAVGVIARCPESRRCAAKRVCGPEHWRESPAN